LFLITDAARGSNVPNNNLGSYYSPSSPQAGSSQQQPTQCTVNIEFINGTLIERYESCQYKIRSSEVLSKIENEALENEISLEWLFHRKAEKYAKHFDIPKHHLLNHELLSGCSGLMRDLANCLLFPILEQGSKLNSI
jgi:hypothetical protein